MASLKIGITGGTGNISAYITRRLVAAGHEVVLFNRSGRAPEGATAVRVDRGERDAFIEAVRGARLQVGIDMLCFNAEDARTSLEAFTGVEQFLHCSTGGTYGFPLPLPITEELPCLATDPYAKQKHEADTVFLEAFHRDRFPVTILKPNGTYGEGWRHWLPGQLPGSWLRRVVDGKPIVVVGDGDQIHHFLHSDDSACGFVHCIGNPRTIGQVFNLCSIVPTTWRQFHEATMRVLEREVPIVGIDRDTLTALGKEFPAIQPKNNWFHMLNSTDKLRRCVPEFRQAFPLEAGLRDIMQGFDPQQVEANPPEIDQLLDVLVERHGRLLA